MGACCSTNGSDAADRVRPMSPPDHDSRHSLEADLRAAGMQTIQLDAPSVPKKADPAAPSTASLYGSSAQDTAAVENSKHFPAGTRSNRDPIPSVTLARNGTHSQLHVHDTGLSSVSNSKRSSPKLISAKPSTTIQSNSTAISAALVSLPNAAHTNSFIVAHTSKSSITALDASGNSQPIVTSSTPKATSSTATTAVASTTSTGAPVPTLSNANASAATAKMEEEQRKARKAAKKEKKEKKEKQKKKETPIITVDSPPSLNAAAGGQTRMRRTLSLEEEEDERTARSLRNFEAERVLEAQEQALMVTFHQAQLESSGTAGGGLSSASPSVSPPTTARGRGMLISPTSVARFPTPSASVGTVHFVNLASPNSGTSTPPSSSHHHDAYANPDLLNEPAASALFTPTGQRTAMALLLSSNLTSANASAAPSGRNSPAHGPMSHHGHNGIAIQEDFLSPKQAAQFHATAEHRKQFSFGARSLMLHAQSSRTVPSSPRESRDTSPVHSFARTPRGKLQAHLPPISTNITVKMSTADNTPTGNGPTSLGAAAVAPAASNMKVPTRTHPRTLAPLSIPAHTISQSANNSPRPHHHSSQSMHTSSNAIHPIGIAAPLTSTAASVAGHCPLIADSLPRRPASAQGTGNGLPSAWRPQNYTKQTAYQRFQARLKAAATAPQGINSKQLESAWNQA